MIRSILNFRNHIYDVNVFLFIVYYPSFLDYITSSCINRTTIIPQRDYEFKIIWPYSGYNKNEIMITNNLITSITPS
jgi:hypothetical protein